MGNMDKRSVEGGKSERKEDRDRSKVVSSMLEQSHL